MPRRRKTSGFEDLIAVGALMPWWLAVILAVIAYFFFHHFASVMEPAPTTMAGLGTYAGRGLWKVVAGFAQWVVPIGLLFGAIVSAINRFKTRRHYETTAQLGSPGGLLQMSWQDFEKLVAEHFRRQDYQVTHTGRPGPDGGVDVELRKGGELSLVQAKHWRATMVGVSTVRELYGVMSARGAAHGFVVTSGVFTPDAAAFAQGRNITLIDGRTLIRDMSAKDGPRARVEPVIQSRRSADAPLCPACRSVMRRRVAKKGASAGSPFWGCTRYPACRGILPIA